jgi:voltage-gated potassium channel Kch
MWVKMLTGKIALTLKSAAMLGMLIGLGILTKTTALGLIPFSMLVLVIVAWRARDARVAIAGNVAMLAVIALISGWWFARNHILYGDPLAYRLMSVSALFPRAGELTLAELFQISLPWLWQTFWGGPTPGDFSPIILGGLAILAVLAMVGFTIFVLRIAYSVWRVAFVILAAWLAFILFAQIQFIRTTTGADQGRYLFPAISVIALIFVVGLEELVSHFTLHVSRFTLHVSRFTFHASRFGSLAHWLIGSFLVLALYVPFAYTLPAYARPALLSPSDLARITHPFTATFAEEIELLGYNVDARAITPGETLRVALYWRARAPMRESYRVFVHVVGAENRRAGGVDVIPARGRVSHGVLETRRYPARCRSHPHRVRRIAGENTRCRWGCIHWAR